MRTDLFCLGMLGVEKYPAFVISKKKLGSFLVFGFILFCLLYNSLSGLHVYLFLFDSMSKCIKPGILLKLI
jgi:hypothetical protein